MKEEERKDLKFQMDQLRVDKLILTAEAISVLLASIVFHILLIQLSIKSVVLTNLFYVFSLAFFVRMLVKNIKRKQQIRKLERKLYGSEIKYLR